MVGTPGEAADIPELRALQREMDRAERFIYFNAAALLLIALLTSGTAWYQFHENSLRRQEIHSRCLDEQGRVIRTNAAYARLSAIRQDTPYLTSGEARALTQAYRDLAQPVPDCTGR